MNNLRAIHNVLECVRHNVHKTLELPRCVVDHVTVREIEENKLSVVHDVERRSCSSKKKKKKKPRGKKVVSVNLWASRVPGYQTIAAMK